MELETMINCLHIFSSQVFGSAMQEWEARSPGRIITVPEKSVYSDIPGLEKGNIDNSPVDARR